MADAKLSALTTEHIAVSDSDILYLVRDPGGAPSSGKIQQINFRRYIPRGLTAINGLVLSNDGLDANNDIDISAGSIDDGTGAYRMILPSALVKRLDASWAVGTNQGGLDTGSKANSTWYHVWLIARVDTHVVDALFSTSATAPSMPANYTLKRRIGAVLTNSSGNLIGFLQYGDDFIWKSPPFLDINDTTLTTSRKNYTLSGVPTGLVVLAHINLNGVAAAARNVYFSNPNLTDLAPSTSALPLSQLGFSTVQLAQLIRLYTDASAQISARSTGSSTTILAVVVGWTDPRGKW